MGLLLEFEHRLLRESAVPVRRHLQRLAGEFPVLVPARIYWRPLREQNQRMRARLALPQRRRLHRTGQQFQMQLSIRYLNLSFFSRLFILDLICYDRLDRTEVRKGH